MITLDLFESENNKDPKQPGRIENPAIAGTDKTAKSGYYPKPAAPVQKLAQPTDRFDKVTKEGAGDIGAQIRAAYQKIYNAGDDAVEFAYYDSPIFAQYWDEYEGDLDSIIAEVDPSELQVILAELTSAVEDQGLAEGLGDYVGRKLQVKTTKGKPNPENAPRWATAMGQTPQGAWHWLEKDGPTETPDSDRYFPLSGKTEFTGFVSEYKGNQGVAEGPGFDKWADERAASQLHKLKPTTTWVLNVMDEATGEHWAIEIQASGPEMAKERARQQGYKVLRIKEKVVAEDDAGDVEQRMIAKIEKEKQRLAKLKQTDPEAYKREMAKRKTSGRVPPVSTFEDQGVVEGHDNHEFHTSVEKGKFLPSKFGNKRYVYLHDLENESPSTGGPQLVTVDDVGLAKQLADQYGGKVVKTKLDTFRVVKPAEQGVAEMDKSQTPPGRDGGEQGGKEYTARPIKAKDAVSHLHKSLERALSKEKKASPAQVQRNKERWAQRQAEKNKGVAEAQPEPEQQQMDANRRAALRREREPEGSEKIDARLAQQHAQRQEYEKTGKFWLKQKDTQQHISDAFTGKAAANAAALDLLKQRPELRGNLVITAYGPGEQQSVKEAATRFPYPEGSENLGRANMEVLIRAYSTPTSERTTLYFGDKAVELDRNDIEAIAEYYDDKLPTNEARWNFIRAVMNNYDNFQTMLNKIGRRSAAAVRQPGLFQEADKKKDDDDLGKVRDVALQRAISKAKADFPTAGSGLEALAKDFMKSQEQDRRDFDQLQIAKQRHDQLLSQISKVDNEQAQEINDLENQNSVMSQRLQQLQNVNTELEKKLSAMTGRREKRQTSKATTGSSSAASTVSVPTIVAPKPAAKTRIKKQAAPKSKAIKVKPSAAIGSIATQLAPRAAPQLPAPADGDVLPPMFGRSTNPDLQRGKEAATDTEFRDMPIMRGAAPQAQAAAESQNKNKPEVDYDDPRWDAMVSRVGKLAKAGPLKTVWDPVKRVYKNVPASDNKKPVKEQEPSAQGRDAMKNVSDWAERLRVAHELQKDVKLMADPEAKAAVQQRVKDLLAHGIKQGYVK